MKNSKKETIREIKKKKELSGLPDEIIEEALNSQIKKYDISLQNLRPKQLKIIIKETRTKLRLLVGRFQKSFKNRSKLSTKELLKTHSSTEEREDYYPILKKLIKSLKAKSILDLGCGLNPIVLANKNITYYASDIKEDELDLIKKFFTKNKIKGRTFIYDIRKIKNDLPKADLCLLFKILDVIDTAGKNRGKLTEKIIKKVPCKHILVSFSTRKLSGKRMNKPRRFWFEEVLAKLGLKFRKFESDNEVFYLIGK